MPFRKLGALGIEVDVTPGVEQLACSRVLSGDGASTNADPRIAHPTGFQRRAKLRLRLHKLFGTLESARDADLFEAGAREQSGAVSPGRRCCGKAAASSACAEKEKSSPKGALSRVAKAMAVAVVVPGWLASAVAGAGVVDTVPGLAAAGVSRNVVRPTFRG